MPLTSKGRKIMRSMKEQYGPERGEEVFYASRNKGKISGVERMASGGTVAAKKSFPDLTGDGKVTKADILKGRGVKGFSSGGKVYRDPPMEPVSGEEPDAFESAMAFEERRARASNESGKGMSDKDMEKANKEAGYKSDKDRDRYLRSSETQMYRDGGMVRGCKSIQMTGKGFKGTF